MSHRQTFLRLLPVLGLALGTLPSIADALAAYTKMFSGYIADKLGHRKLLVVVGYGLTPVGQVLLALALGWPLILLGRLAPTTGRASLGASVAIGEIDQARTGLAEDAALGDAFEAAMPQMTPADVRTLLAKFGLKADHVVRPASTLSPGERTRAALALLQARGVNLLVLDEPTNHLDLPAIEQLESALASYPGTLLLVTHDRRMLSAVATTRELVVEGGRVRER